MSARARDVLKYIGENETPILDALLEIPREEIVAELEIVQRRLAELQAEKTILYLALDVLRARGLA